MAGMGASLPRSLQFTTEVSRLWLWVVTAVAEVISWLYKIIMGMWWWSPYGANRYFLFILFIFRERKKSKILRQTDYLIFV